MSRAHAARQLLALGALTSAQFREITGWTPPVCRDVLHGLERGRQVARTTNGRWQLPARTAA